MAIVKVVCFPFSAVSAMGYILPSFFLLPLPLPLLLPLLLVVLVVCPSVVSPLRLCLRLVSRVGISFAPGLSPQRTQVGKERTSCGRRRASSLTALTIPSRGPAAAVLPLEFITFVLSLGCVSRSPRV